MDINLNELEVQYVVNGTSARLFSGIKGKMYAPVFASDRRDICAVKFKANRGPEVIEAIFLIWKDSRKNIFCLRVDDIDEDLIRKAKKDFIDVAGVSVNNGRIFVKVSSGGTLSYGDPWNKTLEIPMEQIGKLEC